jgi:phage terminase large subunit GpA-like protein
MDSPLVGGMSDEVASWIIRSLTAPLSLDPPSEWVARNIVFDEANNRGPFRLAGREYARDILDDFGRDDVTDECLVFGSQVGKTSILMAGAAWALEHSPGGILWVMTSLTQVRAFARQRFSRLLRASGAVARLIPRGADRHAFGLSQMVLGPTTINFAGSNSPGNLASTPCRRTILDEVDKFDEGTRGEADAVDLAEQRTKDAALPQRWKTSTPTITDGLIWTDFQRGNQMRWHIPCPACGGRIVLAWSKDHTIFELRGNEGFVGWDAKARLSDGGWDLDRVEASAHVVCPHCQHRIEDRDKAAMNAGGVWMAGATAAARRVSRHLPSLYAIGPDVTWGKLAIRFLERRASSFGLQGFVNGDLAEPFVDRQRVQTLQGLIRVELAASADWLPLLSVDVQALEPHFWFVVRKWRDGSSIAIEAGSLNTWEEVAAKQQAHGIPNTRVFVDSGYDTTVVYQQCWRHHQPEAGYIQAGRMLMPMCWSPVKGDDGRKPWVDVLTKVPSPVLRTHQDPFFGGREAGRWLVELLTYRTDLVKDILEALREKRMGALTWEVAEAVADVTYQRHLMSEENRAFVDQRTGRVRYRWAKVGGHRTPNHLLDCEVIQIVGALSLGLFRYEIGAKP